MLVAIAGNDPHTGASDWVEGDNTYIYRLGTEIPGSNGYHTFHAHLTVLKDHFVAILKKRPNPDQYTTSALLAGVLKRVNALATVFTEATDIMHGRQKQAPKGTVVK